MRLGVNDNLVILKKPFDNIEVLQLAHALTKKWYVTEQANFRLETLDKMVQERTRALEDSYADCGVPKSASPRPSGPARFLSSFKRRARIASSTSTMPFSK